LKSFIFLGKPKEKGSNIRSPSSIMFALYRQGVHPTYVFPVCGL
jgi:hypothetical protein